MKRAHQPRADILHREHCACRACNPPRPTPTPAPIARDPDPSFVPLCMLAGVVFGNAIAFAVDAHGAWAALSAAIGALVGARP